MLRIATLLLLTIGFISCQDKNENPLVLNDDIWILHDAAAKEILVSDSTGTESVPALDFLPDGQVLGQGQCNQFSGYYEIESKKKDNVLRKAGYLPLRISIEEKTLLTCPQSEMEQSYMKILDEIKNYQVKENLLILADEMGNNILTFVPSGTIQKKNN